MPPGHDAWVIGDEPAILLDFLGNIDQLGRPTSKDRIVTTLLMTDIVDSTATASRLGDTTWKQMLGEHNRLVRSRLERYLGEEVNTTGDGFLAMFASARGAIRCAASIRDATAAIGLPVRIGIHTGEVELLPGDIGGVAVHAAARVMALGGASDIMVSASTRGLVEDGDLRFEPRGAQEFKGIRSRSRSSPWSTDPHALPSSRKRWISRARHRGGMHDTRLGMPSDCSAIVVALPRLHSQRARVYPPRPSAASSAATSTRSPSERSGPLRRSSTSASTWSLDGGQVTWIAC